MSDSMNEELRAFIVGFCLGVIFANGYRLWRILDRINER